MIGGEHGPYSLKLTEGLEARSQWLQNDHHIIPPIAIAMVLQAEAVHNSATMHASFGDKDGLKVLTSAYLASWSEIGKAFGGVGTPMGLTHLRIYTAARELLERTIKENQAFEERLQSDPAFARQYAETVAGATAEALIEQLKSNTKPTA